MTKPMQIGILAMALAGGGYFAKLMADMVGYMGEMTAQVGRMSQDVTRMADAVVRMQQTMAEMQTSMGRMDQTIHKGSEQFQRWNPMDVFQQAVPAGQAPRP
jgi:hypothetical protein